MTTTLRTLLAALAALLVLAPGTADADTREVADADDATGLLDLASATHRHAGGLLVHTLRMQGRWRSSVLDGGLVTIQFKMGDRYRTLDIDRRRGTLVGRICSKTARGALRNCSRDVDLSRPDRLTLEVALARSVLRTRLPSYQWQVVTLLDSGEGGCTDTICLDQVRDDDRWVRHRL